MDQLFRKPLLLQQEPAANQQEYMDLNAYHELLRSVPDVVEGHYRDFGAFPNGAPVGWDK